MNLDDNHPWRDLRQWLRFAAEDNPDGRPDFRNAILVLVEIFGAEFGLDGATAASTLGSVARELRRERRERESNWPKA